MTGGSTTTWSEFDRYRQVGAMARDMLVARRRRAWKVAPGECAPRTAVVICGGKQRSATASSPRPRRSCRRRQTVGLKDPKDWKIIGKPTRRLDSPEKVTGKAQFGIDVRLPGHAAPRWSRAPPASAARSRASMPTKAKACPASRRSCEVPSGVAVVAEHFWAAKRGRDALEGRVGRWAPAPELDTAKLRGSYRELAASRRGKAIKSAGDAARTAAPLRTQTLEAEYELPYLAHAPMEPLNCTCR